MLLYVMIYAIVTSGPMAEHNNGRLNMIGLGLGLGRIGHTPQATHDVTTTSDNDLFGA